MTLAGADARLGNTEWVDNWTIGEGLRMEIMEITTRNVWLCHDPVTEEQARSLEIPPGHVLSGLGGAVADIAYFDRSPDAHEDGPLDGWEIDGLRFGRVARPMDRDTDVSSAVVVTVDKYHSMLYRAGRTIEVLEFGDGSGFHGPLPSSTIDDVSA